MTTEGTNAGDPLARLRALLTTPAGDDARRQALALLRAVPEPRRKPDDALERFAFKVRSAFGKSVRDPLSAAFIVENESAWTLAAHVLGDDDGGRWTWSFADATTLPDDEAVAWMRALERMRVAPGALLALAEETFRARQRGTWMPAAHAIAAVAAHDASARALLDRLWRESQPNPLAGLAAADGPHADTHMVRHGFYLAMCWVASGGDPAALAPPLPLDALLKRKLPNDAADGSATLAGLSRLLSAPSLAERARTVFAQRLRESVADPQQEDVTRAVLSSLRHDGDATPLCDTAAKVIRAPRWTSARAREAMVDQLWSWVETARCFRDLGRASDLDAMRSDAERLGVTDLLALALGEQEPSPEAPGVLVDAARAVFDVDAFMLMSWRACAAGTVRLTLLASTEAYRELPLANVLALALRGTSNPPRPDDVDGTVGEALEGALVRHFCTHAKRCPKVLLRDRRYAPTVVERLVAVPSGDVAIQAALQTEALLRAAADDASRLDVLWRMIAREPPAEFYAQLGRVLRGRDTLMHRVVARLEALAAMPERATDTASLRSEWKRLTEHVLSLLGGPKEPPDEEGAIAAGQALTVLARSMAAGATLEGLPTAGQELNVWLERLRAIVFGERRGRQGGLCYWSDWVRYRHERDDGERELEVLWEDFASHLVDLDGVRDLSPSGDVDAAMGGLRGLASEYGAANERWRATLDGLLEAVAHPLESEDALQRIGSEFDDKLREAGDELFPLLRGVRDEARPRFLTMRATLERVAGFFKWLAWPERRMLSAFIDELLQRIDERRVAIERLVDGEIRALRHETLEGRRARFNTLRGERAKELAETALERAIRRMRTAFRHDLDLWTSQGREAPVRGLAAKLERDRSLTPSEVADLNGASHETRDAAQALAAMPGGDAHPLVVDAPECQRVGQFLLRHLLFEDARRFHARVRSDEANVPSVRSYFVPLFANLAGGTFLVLDVGTVWDQTLSEQVLRPGYWWVTATSLAASLALFYQGLAMAVPHGAAESRSARLLDRREVRLFLRVLPPWGISLVFSTAIAGFILWTLQGTGEYMQRHALLQALLWGGLSLFLGVFLNVTLQDKKFVRGEEG